MVKNKVGFANFKLTANEQGLSLYHFLFTWTFYFISLISYNWKSICQFWKAEPHDLKKIPVFLRRGHGSFDLHECANLSFKWYSILNQSNMIYSA